MVNPYRATLEQVTFFVSHWEKYSWFGVFVHTFSNFTPPPSFSKSSRLKRITTRRGACLWVPGVSEWPHAPTTEVFGYSVEPTTRWVGFFGGYATCFAMYSHLPQPPAFPWGRKRKRTRRNVRQKPGREEGWRKDGRGRLWYITPKTETDLASFLLLLWWFIQAAFWEPIDLPLSVDRVCHVKQSGPERFSSKQSSWSLRKRRKSRVCGTTEVIFHCSIHGSHASAYNDDLRLMEKEQTPEVQAARQKQRDNGEVGRYPFRMLIDGICYITSQLSTSLTVSDAGAALCSVRGQYHAYGPKHVWLFAQRNHSRQACSARTCPGTLRLSFAGPLE